MEAGTADIEVRETVADAGNVPLAAVPTAIPAKGANERPFSNSLLFMSIQLRILACLAAVLMRLCR
jgi:hypothetical protein